MKILKKGDTERERERNLIAVKVFTRLKVGTIKHAVDEV